MAYIEGVTIKNNWIFWNKFALTKATNYKMTITKDTCYKLMGTKVAHMKK